MRIGRDRAADGDVVYQISEAPKPLSQDIRSREAKYLFAMGIRIVAFLLIVILPIDWPWKIGLAVLALALPYVAVVYANGGREPSKGQAQRYQDPYLRALLPGDGEPAGPAGAPEPLVGRVVDDEDGGPGSV